MLPARNYYQRKTIELWKHQAITGLLLLIIISLLFRGLKVWAETPETYHYELTEKEVEVEVFRQPRTIEEDIRFVFGKYADLAMRLLTDPACHENLSLNPSAVNDNTLWGGVGKDYGIFQINSTWQRVQNEKFLLDPAINIRIAWRIFEDSGYSFERWTCGKELGI